MARETVASNLECKKCNISGVLFVSEDGNPINGFRREFETIPKGFRAARKFNNGEFLGVACAKCGDEIDYYSN